MAIVPTRILFRISGLNDFKSSVYASMSDRFQQYAHRTSRQVHAEANTL